MDDRRPRPSPKQIAALPRQLCNRHQISASRWKKKTVAVSRRRAASGFIRPRTAARCNHAATRRHDMAVDGCMNRLAVYSDRPEMAPTTLGDRGVLKTWCCIAIRFLQFSCRLSTVNQVELTGIFRNALAEGHIHRSLGQRERQRPTAQGCDWKRVLWLKAVFNFSGGREPVLIQSL